MIPADRAFIESVRSATLPVSAFRHKEHVRLAFLCVAEYGLAAGSDLVHDTIVRFAAACGHSEKFHETLTAVWPRLVAAHLRPGDADFAAFIEREAVLLDKSIPLRFYSQERLHSQSARKRVIEPDCADLPRIPAWCMTKA